MNLPKVLHIPISSIGKLNFLFRSLQIERNIQRDFIDFFVRFAYNINRKSAHDRATGGIVMIVTATEFKTNLGKYLELAAKQDVFITKNGKSIARLTSPSINKLSILDDLVGIIPPQEDIDTDRMKDERLSRQ